MLKSKLFLAVIRTVALGIVALSIHPIAKPAPVSGCLQCSVCSMGVMPPVFCCINASIGGRLCAPSQNQCVLMIPCP